MSIDLYGKAGLDIYERTHYSRGEHIEEVRQILTWLPPDIGRVLDVGCSAGLHTLELARRGYSVTGIDIEPFAVERAKSRARREGLPARFRVIDITQADLSELGSFDFIYSLGNVLSHIKKEELPAVLRKVRAGLASRGVFLFDLLTKGTPLRTKVRDDYHGIYWVRELDELSGRIGMDAFFVRDGLTQHFDVWGYDKEEALGLIAAAGFLPDGVSDRLDFATSEFEDEDAFCLYFRAQTIKGPCLPARIPASHKDDIR